jgi:hypothetical protein
VKLIRKNQLSLLITVISIIASYYIAIILHEWGHGTVAWLYGYKKAFFDVQYGGWRLQDVDENVPYDQILAAKQGVAAAMIGIAGLSVSIVLFLVSLTAMAKIKYSVVLYSFFYWFSVINMVPIIQYLTVQTFSVEGDVGRFTHGLDISPWWVFVLGTLFICFALYRFLRFAVPKAYALIPIKTLWVKRCFLAVSLGIMFLLIYSGGYNPLSDRGMPVISKVYAVLTMFLVPVLFFLCNPSLKWVKKQTQKFTAALARKKA